MSELPSPSEPGAAQAAAPAGAARAPRGFLPDGRFERALALVVLALVIAVGLLWWRGSSDLAFTQREFARRIAEADARSVASAQTAREAADALIDANKQIAVLEAKIGESQSQQAALEQMYQELSRNRDDIELADLEQSVATAAQQLQLTGNVQAAIIALQNADGRLARANRPQFTPVRRALARDIDRLKALPSADISGLAVKLDQIIALVETMPSLIDEQQVPLAPRAPKAAPAKGGAPIPEPAAAHWWNGLFERAGAELRNLVRIREVGTPEALLLAPSQAYFLRENLKLRLLNARLQLLARNESGFRADLQSALDWTGRYFDQRARTTQAVETLVRQLQAAEVSVDLPSLSDSLNVIRNFHPSAGVPAAPGRAGR